MARGPRLERAEEGGGCCSISPDERCLVYCRLHRHRLMLLRVVRYDDSEVEDHLGPSSLPPSVCLGTHYQDFSEQSLAFPGTELLGRKYKCSSRRSVFCLLSTS